MRSFAPAGIVCCLLSLACGGSTAIGPDVVARLGEQEIGYSDFEDYLRMNSLDSEVGLASPVLSGLFDQFLLEELLLAVAREEGIADGDRRRMVEHLIESRTADKVDDAAIEAYFRTHPEEFHLEERVTLRQILVDDRPQAESALERLRNGEPFEHVARSVQGEDTGGWEQSELTRDSVPPAFVDVIFALDEGEVSEIVEADYGFFLFEVTRRQPEEQLTLAEATPRIRQRLQREAADAALAQLVAEAAQRYNVSVFAQNLPFDYQGNHLRNVTAP
jgi:parvulin-like peptidyl-prolyl isomerase